MGQENAARGPLGGLRVLELAGIGPGPFAAMLLADLGAEVIRIDRPGESASRLPPERDPTRRGRRNLVLDLKRAEAVAVLLRLVETADVLIEGFRPGVAERLGFGPEPCLERNPRLVYGRMTGFGQDGPLAQAAGHDLTYIALAGALHGIGRAGEAPVPPLNLVGDYGGGAMFLICGVLAALFERGRSGRGQVVDAAMAEGAALLMTPFYGLFAAGLWSDARGENLLDGGAPFYDSYRTEDGGYLAIAALEPKFFAELARLIGLSDEDVRRQYDRAHWPALRARIAAIVARKTRAEWVARLEGSDACAHGVLSLAEAPHHPHNAARRSFIEINGVTQPAPAPRFSRTPPAAPRPPAPPGADDDAILTEAGLDPAALRAAGVLG
ncbi:CaiB/BaiF CoA transferase family protein [Acidibrevibacterium fodinaquatile]|uniref:CaiB/BaiF CoA transferase family protein n=1 Tax=Acidibrevibacterium fodinaquatile TaxID=1969806 RepID=UPI000E0D6685|nr:CaiB/BaiF CoA-transferase family protein [Acidibrevibacterium fodinaquatile]